LKIVWLIGKYRPSALETASQLSTFNQAEKHVAAETQKKQAAANVL
jgi:hypothetical protein